MNSSSHEYSTETGLTPIPVPIIPPADCAPDRRIAGVSEKSWVADIRFHESEAKQAMNNLCCGSDNGSYRRAHAVADAHWRAAALIRLHLGIK
jgi:hypothetical protein